MCPYNSVPLQTAVNRFLCYKGSDEAKERNEATTYYTSVLEAVEEQHRKREGLGLDDIRKAMHFDPDKGFVGVKSSCEKRWGSVGHAAGEHLPASTAIVLRNIRRSTLGTDAAKVIASVAIVSF